MNLAVEITHAHNFTNIGSVSLHILVKWILFCHLGWICICFLNLCNKIICLKLLCFFLSSPGPSWAFRIVRSKGWVMKLCRALLAEILHVGSSEGFVFFVFPLSMTLIHVLLHPWVRTSKMFGYAMYTAIYITVYVYVYINVNSATYHLFTKIFNQCLFIFSFATVSFLWISIGHLNHLHGQSFNILKSPRKRYSISNQRH